MGHQLHPRLTTKMGVNMEAAEVAEAIQMVAQGKRVGQVLGGSAKMWSWLDKLLPESGRLWLVRYLTGH